MSGLFLDAGLRALDQGAGSTLGSAETVVSNAIGTAGSVFGGLWSFAESNPIIMIIFVITVVGIGLGLFMSLKSKFSGKKRGKGRR